MKKQRRKDPDLRNRVLKRDKHTCQLCRKKKRSLEIHHIQRWADASMLRFDEGNCISLCKPCHYSIRGKETYYAQLFFEIIHGKK